MRTAPHVHTLWKARLACKYCPPLTVEYLVERLDESLRRRETLEAQVLEKDGQIRGLKQAIKQLSEETKEQK